MDEKIFVTRPYLPPRDEFDAYLDEIWENRWLTNQGPLHERFISALKTYLQVDNVTPTVNGHMALEIALRALGITGEVITTPFTFASTPHALSLCGIRPVFCDIRASDFTIDPEQIEPLITENTTAILPVHVYGHLCDTEKIDNIARKYNLKVIYDAAHAFGVRKGGVSAGLFGDVSMFSFHATKLFNSIEGGALVYRDAQYEPLFNSYKNFGIKDEESIPFIGGNAKMNEFQAAMGLAILPHMPDIIAQRQEYTFRYRELLSDIPGIHFFMPETQNDTEYNYAYFPIVVDAEKFGLTRDALHIVLQKYNIYARKYFYPIASDYQCYRHTMRDAQLPIALRAGKRVMTLPLYTDMGIDTVQYVCKCIKACCSRSSR